MSVVAVKKTNEKIVVAADSIGVKGWSKSTNVVKLAEINGVICGNCGTAEEGALMYQFLNTHKPANAEENSLLDFLAEFIRWRKELTGNGYIENEYIFVVGSKVFKAEQMYIVEVNDYCAIGAGEDFATAAMYFGHTPQEAVQVACDLSCFVAGPIRTFERVI